jgi:sulfate transport system ATP-binding protein
MKGTSIEIRHLHRSFGPHHVLRDVSLSIRPGELLALLGPSGSGKTTLLRLIAGLDVPDEGEISFDRDDALGRAPKERGVGFVFQHYALFRHMSVFENIAFALRVRRTPKSVVHERVTELLRLIQLETLAAHYPAQLSGGQRQRVALARALAIQPRVLLLDEPFGALDAVVRRDLRRWLRQLHEEMAITTLFVTHDQEEAFELADRVVIMNGGQICQEGTPIEIYRAPADLFVHEFLGESNRLHGQVKAGRVIADAGFALGHSAAADGAYQLVIRPHHVDARPDATGAWTIGRIAASGARARLTLHGYGTAIEAELAAEQVIERGLSPGSAVAAHFGTGILFAPDGTPSGPFGPPPEPGPLRLVDRLHSGDGL